jgi:hypothetical protein
MDFVLIRRTPLTSSSGTVPDIRCSQVQVRLPDSYPLWRVGNHFRHFDEVPLQARGVSVPFDITPRHFSVGILTSITAREKNTV